MTQHKTKYSSFKWIMLLAFLACMHYGGAQTGPTVWLKDFRNAAFDSLGVKSSKAYARYKGGESRLQQVAVYDTQGYIVSADTFSYDEQGRVALTQRTVYLHRPGQVTQYDIQIAEGRADTLMSQVFYFDERDRLKEKVEWKAYSGYTTKELYHYDQYDNCVLVAVSGNGMFPKEDRYDRQYDAQGNQLSLKRNHENMYENTYDESSRLLQRDYGHVVESFSYDDKGHLHTQTVKAETPEPPAIVMYACSDMEHTYRYNRKGRLKHYSVSCESNKPVLVYGLNYTKTYRYHRNGLLKKYRFKAGKHHWTYRTKYAFEK